MALLSRTVIWRTAWGVLPVAMALNLWFGFGVESEMRFQQQAYANAMAGRWAEAAALYERAARAAPDSAVAAYNTSAAFQMVGDFERAERWNARALQLDPEMELALGQREELAKKRRGARDGPAAARYP